MVAGVLMVDLETLLDTKGARDVGRSHIRTGVRRFHVWPD